MFTLMKACVFPCLKAVTGSLVTVFQHLEVEIGEILAHI